MLSLLVRRFRWEVADPNTEWELFPLRSAKNGLPLRLHAAEPLLAKNEEPMPAGVL